MWKMSNFKILSLEIKISCALPYLPGILSGVLVSGGLGECSSVSSKSVWSSSQVPGLSRLHSDNLSLEKENKSYLRRGWESEKAVLSAARAAGPQAWLFARVRLLCGGEQQK